LLHRREIDKIAGTLAEKGLTLVPIRMYFKDGIAKLELGIGRGKRTVDKRNSIREREHKREMDRSIRNANR
jgi:SsrA-binding protein